MALSDAVAFATAAWDLDESSGTRADSVGSNDLSDNNTVGVGTGMFGNAADFEASVPEWLTATDHADLSVTDQKFCVRCWINPESTGLQWILAKGDSVNAQELPYSLNLTSSTEVRFLVGNNVSSGQVTASTFGALSTGTWYHIVAWHDPDSNVVGIAVNGTSDTAAWTGGAFDDAQELNVGSLQTAGVLAFDGLIDDIVLLKDYFLDSDEIAADYNSGTGVAFANWAGGAAIFTKNIFVNQAVQRAAVI